MKNNLLLGLCLIAIVAVSCQKNKEIAVDSPSGTLSAHVNFSNNHLSLSVVKEGKLVLPSCSTGLLIDSINIGENARLLGEVTTKTIDETYEIYGNHTYARNSCREISIPLQCQNLYYKLLIRAYDDGVAIRYMVSSEQKLKVNAEMTCFNLPDSAICYWADYKDSNEDLHHISTFKEIPESQTILAPLTVKSGNFYLSFTEADCVDFPDMAWEKVGGTIKSNYPTNPDGWTSANSYVISPWRLVIVADDLNSLVNSDLVTNLCPAPETGSDFSWVKPGRVLWQWWSSGAPVFSQQKNWYDAAARLKWEYYLIDDGWRDWQKSGKNQWDCLKEVIAYGKTKGVNSLVWADSKEMRDSTSLYDYLAKIKDAGASGIKIDFIPPATPEIMQWYETARRAAYHYQLMCDFHGCVKPSGLNRTWPHEMTREGVRGNEYQMTRYDRLMPLEQDEIIPFTRFIAGPADFTPVIFNPKELRGYTWSHELAQALVFYSPLTHFADSYHFYLDNPAEDILRDIPVTWDETIVLPCTEIGRMVAFARRKGDVWWIGILNGGQIQDASFNLDFIKEESSATILSDSNDRPDSFIREEKEWIPNDQINIRINRGGGYLVRIRPKDPKAVL